MMLALVSCGKSENSGDNAGIVTDASGYTGSVENYKIGDFDAELISYLCLNGYEKSDFAVSPTALRAALGIAAASSQSSTRTELLSAAGFSSIDSVNSWYSGIKDPKAFSVESSVWGNTDLMAPFTESYTANIKESYNVDAKTCTSDEVTSLINDWLGQKTNGTVQDAGEDLDGLAAVMVSTVRLQAAWKDMFSEASSIEGVFFGMSGDGTTMEFMDRTGEYLYAEESGTKILAIPMEGGLSFVCFIGSRTDMFDKMTSLKTEKVHVVLPKFEIESVFDVRDFSGFLLSRGVRDATDEKKANFYNMCAGSDWFIQEIVQRIKISTDEKGIGSAAENTKADANSVGAGAEVQQFAANEPFSFAIFSGLGTSSQHMLIYGQMMNGN